MEKRLEDLEVRYSFQEDTIRQLDQVVQELSQELQELRGVVRALRAQLETQESHPNKLEDEKPPHY